jgi:Spy/CpxP family protein refolding chaperone
MMMYPGFHWWRARRCGTGYGAHVGGHGFAEHAWDERRATGDRLGDGGGLGVRRPLRFLAGKLDLDERQVADLAKILAELKTERAQAEVDSRRTLSAFADALAGETFDEASAREAGKLRVTSAERLREAVVRPLGQMHALLEPGQRERLAYLIRTGTLTL